MPLGKTILVVDDEDAIRTILNLELSGEGFIVETASDGDEAIELLRVKSYDLVLLDNKMERLSGMDVLRFIKEESIHVKTIMITAFADLRTALEAKKLGADDFISKPYQFGDLLHTIEKVLGEEIPGPSR